MVRGKKFVLDLPIKILLTEEGVSNFLSNNKHLTKIHTTDNTEEYGIALKSFAPQSIQNMMMIDYINRIELSMSEYASKRQDVIDLCKVIIYSVLYKRFDKEVFRGIVDAECVRRHNRDRVGEIIDEQTRINDKVLRKGLMHKNDLIDKIRTEILSPVWNGIMSNSEYPPEEKNVYLLMTEKFMNRMSLLNWHVLVLFHDDEGFGQMVSIIRKALGVYMGRSHVSDYIATMLIELIQNNENANIKKEARALYPLDTDLNSVILNSDERAKIVARLEQKKEQVTVTWKVGGSKTAIGKQNRLQITLYNRADRLVDLKENFDAAVEAKANKKTLVDFYRELPADDGSELGMYYLSYLDEACRNVNVKFESVVNNSALTDLLVFTLTFNF